MKRMLSGSVMLLATLGLVVAAWGWHEKEHYGLTVAAGRLLPDDMPAFFREGLPTVAAHCSVDPDIFKELRQPQLARAERPEHYFDREYFPDAELPADRYAFIARCHEKGLDPVKVGLLPYAVAEWTQRLQGAFAEYRKWPQSDHARAKCLVYAGILAHYAADLHQPLHTTVHFDGRVDKPGDESPATGIHRQVDGLLRRIQFQDDWLAGVRATAYEGDLFAAIMREFDASHDRVDRVYELADRLPTRQRPAIDDSVETFARDRARASARFIASLYLTAWTRSADAKLPGWLRHDQLKPLTESHD